MKYKYLWFINNQVLLAGKYIYTICHTRTE